VRGGDIDPTVHSDGTIFLIGGEHSDRFTGQQAFDGLVEVLDVFELTEPIEGVSHGDLWGPSLVRPSEHTYMSKPSKTRWTSGPPPSCVVHRAAAPRRGLPVPAGVPARDHRRHSRGRGVAHITMPDGEQWIGLPGGDVAHLGAR
jgi:hypothetical protein